LVSPDIKFSLQVFTENDLDKFPAIVLHDLKVHSQYVYRFDGVRTTEFLKTRIYKIPGIREAEDFEKLRNIDANAGDEDSDEDSDPWAAQKPRVVSVLWVVGSRDGIQVLWIFRHDKVYEVGDQRWVEYDRSTFDEEWGVSVRICFVSYGAVGFMQDHAHRLLGTPPTRIYRDSTDRPLLDFLTSQEKLVIPYPPLSLEWAQTFLKQSLLFPSFYLSQCTNPVFEPEIGFLTMIGSISGSSYDNEVLKNYTKPMGSKVDGSDCFSAMQRSRGVR
jgi:hypothetical protein